MCTLKFWIMFFIPLYRTYTPIIQIGRYTTCSHNKNDGRTQIFSLGKPLATRSVFKTTSSSEFRPTFLEPIPRHVFSINTSSSKTLFLNSIAALTHPLQCVSLIHQQTSKATKWINHANLLFLNIPYL